jgi:Ca2+-binding RTX toxin-like protein
MAILTGTAGRDRLSGTANNDTLSGLDDKDTLTGLAGDDLLDGGAGADTLIGGPGDDVFRADQDNDQAIENAGEGRDRVESTQSFRLPDNVEDLTLLGVARANAKGNALDNVIIGNAAPNVLSGMDGNDRLEGGAGDDRLLGGPGADMLIGGAGRDQYQVDNVGDMVVETAGGGRDHVVATVSITLADNVERLTLGGVADLDGTGNAGSNVIRGNRGANTLAGRAGSDLLEGRGGADTLLGEQGNDTLTVADLGFTRVDGGTGSDLLRLLTGGSIDLTALVPRLQSIERMELAGASGGTTLMVGAADVAALSEATDTLLVHGQANDTVAFDVADGFQAAGSQTRGGVTFDIFVSGTARVFVQRGVAVTGVNAPPVAMADSVSTGENATIAIDVLTNDSDPGDVLTVNVGASTSAGGASLSIVMN